MSRQRYLVTGGAGFIGASYADHLIGRGERVRILDNLSRRGATANLDWLRSRHGETSFELVVGDLRDAGTVAEAVRKVDVIVHLAAQVAVTTSLTDPRQDFDINAGGTLNLLEAARHSERQPALLYASTNKVYGNLEQLSIVEERSRYCMPELPAGVPETWPVQPFTPYGCSKGAADQYVQDYHRVYGLPTVVLRQSCIYGPQQLGIEDQGWVAWFVIAALSGRPITIYGSGRQVRDLLEIGDLIRCYDLALERIDEVAGRVLNIGGGPDNTISVYWELWPLLEQELQQRIEVSWGDWRPGDQPIYISDISMAARYLGWQPSVRIPEGLQRLVRWVRNNIRRFA